MDFWNLRINDEKINISQNTMVTHLTELFDPLLGPDPQFGKCWPN